MGKRNSQLILVVAFVWHHELKGKKFKENMQFQMYVLMSERFIGRYSSIVIDRE